MKKQVSVKVLILAIALTVVGMSAGYVVAETTNNTISAAYNKKTGILRYLTNPSEYNAKIEVPISWYIEGPAGPQGESGSATNTAYAFNPNPAIPVSTGQFTTELISGEGENPSVTVNITNGAAFVTIAAAAQSRDTFHTGFTISGATVRDADMGSSVNNGTVTLFVAGLNNGPNTFSLAHMFPDSPGMVTPAPILIRYISVTPVE